MSIITIHQQQFDVDCIIFDKDDTLVKFDAIWLSRTHKWVEAIATNLSLNSTFMYELFDLLGYSPTPPGLRAESPLAIATMDTLNTLAAGVICRYGFPWHEARLQAEICAQNTMNANFTTEEIIPIGNPRRAMEQLARANIRIGIVTSDNRAMTEATLAYLGIADFISAMVCGDDSLPSKPAPEAFWEIARQLEIAPQRMMMVGDTISDMQFAINADAAYRIGVASHSNNILALSAHADAIITSIDEIIAEGG
ncbi:MAG: HAD family hydrolase [Chloroflexi bacterium]|jgi:phosphoglycolate phosphatase|nr:HAD family hydrolase [Chloroflexota bacterium]